MRQTMSKFFEKIYQKNLQLRYGYGHKRLPCGITDITTPKKHIEIKEYSLWKHALGQILAYNHYDPKENLEVHLFGEYPTEKKEIAKAVFNKFDITVIDVNIDIDSDKDNYIL